MQTKSKKTEPSFLPGSNVSAQDQVLLNRPRAVLRGKLLPAVRPSSCDTLRVTTEDDCMSVKECIPQEPGTWNKSVSGTVIARKIRSGAVFSEAKSERFYDLIRKLMTTPLGNLALLGEHEHFLPPK